MCADILQSAQQLDFNRLAKISYLVISNFSCQPKKIEKNLALNLMLNGKPSRKTTEQYDGTQYNFDHIDYRSCFLYYLASTKQNSKIFWNWMKEIKQTSQNT